MHDTFYCGRRALATFAFGLFACFQAMAAEPLPEGAAEMINAVRQQAAGCALVDALRGWIRSEGHCRNLLDERYSEFGLARVVSERPGDRYRVYWTLVLGRPAQPTLRIEGQN